MPELKSILHVEDEPDILEIARLALEVVGGLEVDQFSSGHQAIASAIDREYDLILLDQMMPEISGLDTLSELRKIPHLRQTPAVFMTAQSTEATDLLMQKTDAVAIILKPFDPMVLATELKDIFNAQCSEKD